MSVDLSSPPSTLQSILHKLVGRDGGDLKEVLLEGVSDAASEVELGCHVAVDVPHVLVRSRPSERLVTPAITRWSELECEVRSRIRS